MAEANKDERTLILKSADGEDVSYAVEDMSDEAKVLYNKIQILATESQNIKANAEFAMEKNDILQKHYLEAITPLLNSDEEEESDKEENEDDGDKKPN
jgi:hypothetical protein|tara:strand:- start:1534 stop:1827 length:294 start_codon:yes stop_codon:yes gene_type:complete